MSLRVYSVITEDGDKDDTEQEKKEREESRKQEVKEMKRRLKAEMRYLDILDGSYRFADCVHEQQRAWWKQVAKRYLSDLIRTRT